MARLFFAVWPDEAAALALEALAVALADVAGGKPVPREKIHLTLAFLGEVSGDRVEDAVAAGAEARGAPFRLRLDEVGSFRRSEVAWAGCSRAPAGLASLQSDLAASLAARGFTLEERAFAPHITLARRIRKAVPRAPTEAIAWDVRDVTLVRSETGTGRYAVMQRWPLGT
jgi:2'-5' RNA ligase